VAFFLDLRCKPAWVYRQVVPTQLRLKKWLASGAGLAIVGLLVTVFLPEIRKALHLEKPQAPPQQSHVGSGGSTESTNAVAGSGNVVGNNNTVIEPGPAAPSEPNAKKVRAPTRKKAAASSTDQATRAPQVSNAPNGMIINGGNVTNPTVNNYGPLPVQITFNAHGVPSTDAQFQYEAEVTISVSASYTPVSLAFVCDSKVEKISSDFGQFSSMRLNERFGIDGDNDKVAFLYFEGSPVTPDHPLYVHLWASTPFRVTGPRQARMN
jgi:hypothetical protein